MISGSRSRSAGIIIEGQIGIVMDTTNEPAVTRDHLLGFGAIIHRHAAVETGIKVGLAAVLGVDLIDVLILTEPYSNSSLRNVAKSISKVNEPISPEVETFLQIVGDFGAFTSLRNNIAHSYWHEGMRPNSIKPSYLAVRDGKAKPVGQEDDEPDWTPKELYAEADKLADLHGRIVKFLLDIGVESRVIPQP